MAFNAWKRSGLALLALVWPVLAPAASSSATQGSTATARVGAPADLAETQRRAYVQALREQVLPRIRMPPGFSISLFALVPGARQMAVSPDQATVWVGTRGHGVWALTDADRDGVAERVEAFRADIDFDAPAGVCLGPDGRLVVAERNRVMAFAVGSQAVPAAKTLIAQGKLIPLVHESHNHATRSCAFGPDQRLYISLGQPYNVTPAHLVDTFNALGIGGIVSFDGQGQDRQVYATGVRNSAGLAFNPKDGVLWFTDNQVDGMGDETPPGELNKAPRAGLWFGFPYYGGGEVVTPPYQGKPIPPELAKAYMGPEVEMIAHAADLGMTFYSGKMFPPRYDNAIFNAQHGSWNATQPRGARVMVTYLDAQGNAVSSEPFAEGWMTEQGTYLGRPADVAQYVDGSLLVSDDKAGVIYRITHWPPR